MWHTATVFRGREGHCLARKVNKGYAFLWTLGFIGQSILEVVTASLRLPHRSDAMERRLSRPRGAQIVIAIVVFLHFVSRIWHFLKFHEVRPFDWIMAVIELAVLFVIAYEAFWRPWQVRRWLKRIYEWFDNGQQIRREIQNAPNDLSADDWTRWREKVDEWYRNVQVVLKKDSPQAAAAFVFERVEPTFRFSDVNNDSQRHYRVLSDALKNLQGIMEKPDIYF